MERRQQQHNSKVGVQKKYINMQQLQEHKNGWITMCILQWTAPSKKASSAEVLEQENLYCKHKLIYVRDADLV